MSFYEGSSDPVDRALEFIENDNLRVFDSVNSVINNDDSSDDITSDDTTSDNSKDDYLENIQPYMQNLQEILYFMPWNNLTEYNFINTCLSLNENGYPQLSLPSYVCYTSNDEIFNFWNYCTDDMFRKIYYYLINYSIINAPDDRNGINITNEYIRQRILTFVDSFFHQ